MPFRNEKENKQELNSDDENESANKIEQIQMTIQDAKSNVNQAINQVIERGENLENLNQKAQDLQFLGREFNNQARRARRKMWCQNLKINIMLICVIFIIALIIYFVLIHPLLTK